MRTIRALTRVQLDDAGCDMPDCGHDHSVLHLSPLCHPQAALKLRYEKAAGVLVISCHQCEQQVVRIAVAK